jgi:hypothetical protein
MLEAKIFGLTLSPPALKTKCFSQWQAFQRLVRSSHTLVNWILNNFWFTELIFNQFRVFLKTLNALCVCLQYKHPRSIKRVIRSDKPITSVFPVKSKKCDFGAEPRCGFIAISAGKGLIYRQSGECFEKLIHTAANNNLRTKSEFSTDNGSIVVIFPVVVTNSTPLSLYKYLHPPFTGMWLVSAQANVLWNKHNICGL